ncbi:MAG: hypothetical protein R3Y61_04970 [Rikenellaceae bacterium]
MKKAIKIILRTICGLIIFLIMLPIVVSIVLQIGFVQKYAVEKTTEILSDIASTKISIGSVALDFFTSARFGEVYIEDYSGDTLIYVDRLTVDIRGINFLNGKITLGKVELKDNKINLYKDSTGIMNVSAVFKNFARKEKNPNPPNFQLTAAELQLNNTHFTMSEDGIEHYEDRVNFKDLDLDIDNITAKTISVYNYNVWLSMENISLKDKSGLDIEHFSSPRCGVDSSGMYYADAKLLSQGSTINLPKLNFTTRNTTWWDWNTFVQNMILEAEIKNSQLSSQTLSLITGVEFYKNTTIEIPHATLIGAVEDIKGEIHDLSLKGTSLDAKYHISGLPATKNALFDIEISKLKTTEEKIEKLSQLFTPSNIERSNRQILTNLGEIEISLKTKGTLNSIKSDITVQSSSSGTIKALCQIAQSPKGATLIDGTLSATNYNVGHTTGVSNLGHGSLQGTYDIDFNGKGDLVFDANITIDSILYNTYAYKDITVDGDFSSGKFNGLIEFRDPNLNMEINGHFDYSDTIPRYSVVADLREADLSAIHLNKRDSISILSAKAEASGSGTSLDDFNGEGIIDKIYYINHTDTVKTSAISIVSIAEPDFKEITLSARFLDIKLRGRNSFNQIFRYFSNSLERFLPSFPEVSSLVEQNSDQRTRNTAQNKINKEEASFPYSDGYYLLTLQVKEANNVSSIFYPSLEISQGSSINFFFNPYLDQFTLRAKSDYITSNDFLINDLNIDSRNIADSLSLYTTIDNLAIGEVYFPNFSVVGGIRSNVITLGAKYNNPETHSSALINTTTRFARLKDSTAQMQVFIHPTAIVFDSIQWRLSAANILMSGAKVEIKDFNFYTTGQRFRVNGIIGNSDLDTLNVHLEKGNIAPLSLFVEDIGYSIKGYADGEVRLINVLDDPKMFASVDLLDIDISDHKLGNAKLQSIIDKENKQILFSLGKGDGSQPPILGSYNIASRIFNAGIELPEVPLSLLDPMLEGIISNSSGNAATDLTLRTENGEISLDGTISFEEFATTIDYTKARYTLKDGTIEVKNSCFHLPQTSLVDSNEGVGQITATLKTESFKNLAYNFSIEFNDLLALNTTLEDNSSFFGKAYASGRAEIKGSNSYTSMSIVASSALNSSVTMPMSGAANIEEAEFIRFVTPKADSIRQENILRKYRQNNQKKRERDSSTEIDINLDITVTNNTLAQIELDPKVGDIIKGRGEGRLLMHINPTLDIFEMTGPVQLTEGDYLFTLQTIINKKFIINPGGQIIWTGDPTNPELNLTAVYKLKTSVATLTGDVSSSSKTNIDCGIILTENMLTPKIDFTITAPSADAETQNALSNSLNTDESLSMQFLSLMLANSFMPDTGTSSIGTMGTNMAEVTGLEFLSNQLSNLISSDKLDIRVGYTPMSETTSDEFSAGVGADLIENVLSLEVDGNYNAQNNVSVSENPFSVDAYLTWIINPSGTLKLKGFTRTIDRFDETQGMQESGVGVYFTQDFNNFEDLKKRLEKSFKTDSANVAKKKAQRLEKKAERKEKKEQKKIAKQEKKEQQKRDKQNSPIEKEDNNEALIKDDNDAPEI